METITPLLTKIAKYLSVYIALPILIGCAAVDWLHVIEGKKNLIVIRGRKEISGILRIYPGTTVIFESIKEFLTETPGELIITNGGSLIAKGTPSQPIKFNPGKIVIEDSANECILEYCEFDYVELVNKSSCFKAYRCKFMGNGVLSRGGRILTVENCTFTRGRHNTFIGGGAILGGAEEMKISYTEITRVYKGIVVESPVKNLVISNSNIVGCDKFAIKVLHPPSEMTIDLNYIADNNNMKGVDLTGEQSYGVKYTNPRVFPVGEAGCGW